MKKRKVISRVTKLTVFERKGCAEVKRTKQDFKVMGYMIEEPIVGNELKFISLNGKEIFTQEIIENVEEIKDARYPRRTRIETFWNTYITDDLNFISQNSRNTMMNYKLKKADF